MKALILVTAAVLAASSLGCASTLGARPRVATPVSLDGDRPLTVRTDARILWVGARPWTETARAWNSPAQGEIEGVSIRALESGHEITFYQGGLKWRGEVDADHRARGPLTRVTTPVASASAMTEVP